MKKTFAVFALFAALVFVISCGGDTDDAQLPECSPTSPTPCWDSSNGLVWSAKAPDEMTWRDAVSYCDNLTEGDYSDWRLPTINELRSLIKNCSRNEMPDGSCAVKDPDCLLYRCWTSETCGSCEYNSTGKYSKFGETDRFWSSSFHAIDGSLAWYVNFGVGGIGRNYKANDFNVVCVR